LALAAVPLVAAAALAVATAIKNKKNKENPDFFEFENDEDYLRFKSDFEKAREDYRKVSKFGNTLKRINHIDNSLYLSQYGDIEIIGLCDVTNPLHGLTGASYIFAPQKGASPEQVFELDLGLKHLEKIVIQDLNIDKGNNQGSGAAGGLGYAIVALLNGKLQKGIDTILDIINFDKEITDETVVITGEGQLDSQSLNGKVISGIIDRINNEKAKVIVVCGKLEGQKKDYYKYGIDDVIITNEENLPFDIVKIKCKEQLEKAIKKISL
jgi:glycerate kinase